MTLRRTKLPQLWVGWEHGILCIQLRLSPKEVHKWRLQAGKEHYWDMLRRPDPDRRMNELLTIYQPLEPTIR